MGLFSWLSARRLKKARQRSASFALAIADSLNSNPQDWSYDFEEKWINNVKAEVALSAPQRMCKTLQVTRLFSNGNGSNILAEYDDSDERCVIDRAYLAWREATSLERERDREIIKARIVIALSS
jgi:hypothetical protein